MVLDTKNNNWVLLDSLNAIKNYSIVTKLATCLKGLLPKNTAENNIKVEQVSSKQKNGNNCGVYLLLYSAILASTKSTQEALSKLNTMGTITDAYLHRLRKGIAIDLAKNSNTLEKELQSYIKMEEGKKKR
jgi:hypothetical protein